jgi:hypothetical protein
VSEAPQRHLPEVKLPDMPDGVSWWCGVSSSSHYTYRFGTDGATDGLEGSVYWDRGGGGGHHVVVYPVDGVREDGDSKVGAYPESARVYETAQKAFDAVPETVSGLLEDRGGDCAT